MSSDTATAAPAYQVRAGYEFPAEALGVTAAEQRRLHGFCDIAEAVYGGTTDPAFIARRPITLNTAAITACHPARGIVHVVHRIRQLAPVPLDATGTLTGRYTAIEDVPRGRLAKSAFEYRRADGSLAMAIEPDMLLADRSRMPAPSGRKPAAIEAEPAGFEVLTVKQCTPKSTLGYCAGTRNLIHTDPDHAQRFGFRAPIIAGNQTVNFLLEGLAVDGAPDSFEVEIRFRRPVFWDDAVTVLGRRGADGRPAELRAVNGDAKLVADCRVLSLGAG